jgi:cell division protein FtsB
VGKLIRFPRKSKPKKDERARALFPPFRVPPAGTDARPHKYKSDAMPDLERDGPTVDPEIDRRRRMRRSWSIAAGVIVFAFGVMAAMFGDRGYLDVRRQEARRQALQTAYDEHVQRVQELQNDIKRLKSDPAAIERIAREQLGFVAEGEITLLLPGDDPSAPFLDAKPGSGIVPVVRKPQSTH